MSTAARIDELLSKFDENPRRYFAPLANEYRKAGDLTQAIALCREHLPKQPGHMSGHIVFGQALFEYGDLVEAQQVFEAALALDPENLIALRHLGDIARGRGDAVSARRWYGRVLEADPRNDDIAALLASLSARATPVATPAVTADAGIAAEEPAASSTPFVDEPAWHTPAILLGHQDVTPEAVEPRPEPELLDLDSFVEPAAEAPSFLGDAPADSASVDDAFGAERSTASGFDALLDIDAVAPATDEALPFEAVPMEELAEPADAATQSAADAVEAESTHDSLSEAIGAFASYDPLDSTAVLPAEYETEATDAASPVAELSAFDAPAVESHVTDYGDGLEAIEWPDASQLSVRTPSPARSSTPADSAPPLADFDAEDLVPTASGWANDDAETLAVEASAGEAPAGEAPEVVAQAEDAAAVADATIDGSWTEAEPEALVEAEVREAEPEALVEAEVREAEPDALVEAEVREAEPEALVEAEMMEAEPEALVEAEVMEFSAATSADAPAEAESAGPMDEDPPFSASEMPWLMTSEDEREAEEADLLEASVLPESPAFVTETMAELLVAQGFVGRAIDVYEELVARRPDDGALSNRLAALRDSMESAAAEAEVEFADAEPAAFEADASAGRMTPIAPLAAFTPARSSTPRAVPFIAPAPRRTAREWLSVLASMQVARRTPITDQVIVSMPTPADGLASLFGASPLPADDVAARSLATAYGGAVPLDSSAPLFASGEFTLPPEPPRTTASSSPVEAASGSGLYSFDRFFPDPATSASGPTTSPEAPAATTPTGSDESTSPGADLAQFSHWLKGLSNS